MLLTLERAIANTFSPKADLGSEGRRKRFVSSLPMKMASDLLSISSFFKQRWLKDLLVGFFYRYKQSPYDISSRIEFIEELFLPFLSFNAHLSSVQCCFSEFFDVLGMERKKLALILFHQLSDVVQVAHCSFLLVYFSLLEKVPCTLSSRRALHIWNRSGIVRWRHSWNCMQVSWGRLKEPSSSEEEVISSYLI